MVDIFNDFECNWLTIRGKQLQRIPVITIKEALNTTDILGEATMRKEEEVPFEFSQFNLDASTNSTSRRCEWIEEEFEIENYFSLIKIREICVNFEILISCYEKKAKNYDYLLSKNDEILF